MVGCPNALAASSACRVTDRWFSPHFSVVAEFYRWATWLREDLGARPYAWLQPDFVPPSPYVVVKDAVAQTSRILAEPHLIDAEFRKAWMPFFCRSGHPAVTMDQFLSFVDPFLPQEAVQDLPRISGQDLMDTARAKQSTAGGLDGWAWNEVKALPLPWFSGLGILLNMVEATGFGLKVFWMLILL